MQPLADDGGGIAYLLASAVIVSERKHAEDRLRKLSRASTVLSAIKHQILHGEDVGAILRSACQIVVRQGQFAMAWIGMVPEPGAAPRVVAHAGGTSDIIALVEKLLCAQPAESCAMTMHASREDLERGLETIERNVRSQTQIVNDLLDMSRIISGKVHLDVRPLHLHEVIDLAIDTVQPAADAKKIRIQSMLDSRIGLVRGDPNRLQQVFWNILSNAIKFTPGGGRIHIVLERVNSHVEICVEDTGIGIQPEILPHVFERFRQGDAATTRRFGGLGLGLSIVRSLVELHGGSVRVKSPGEGLGTTFIVALPVLHVKAEETRQRGATQEHGEARVFELPSLEGVSVLVVDDEADGRALTARMLDDQGARTTCVDSAAAAIEVLSRERIDILLSDIGMPDVDGFELIRRVRLMDDTRTRQLPAVAITAYARTEDRQRSLLAGFHMHLSKPIEVSELIASVAALVRLSR